MVKVMGSCLQFQESERLLDMRVTVREDHGKLTCYVFYRHFNLLCTSLANQSSSHLVSIVWRGLHCCNYFKWKRKVSMHVYIQQEIFWFVVYIYVLFDIAVIWFKLNDLNVVEVYIFGMILESKGRRGMAPYWCPGFRFQGPIFMGRGGAAIATGKVTPCIRLQSFIMQTFYV